MKTLEEIKKRKTFCFWCNKEAKVKKFRVRYLCLSCYKELINMYK